jgi:argininosuccinate lyase
MQEDKEGVFDAAASLALSLAAVAGMARDMRPDAARLEAAAGAGFATATDLADWLVRRLGLPFREAHHVTGRLVAEAERRGCGLESLPPEAFRAVDRRIAPDEVYEVLGVENSVRSRTSFGGTAPARVAEQARWWLARLDQERGDKS